MYDENTLEYHRKTRPGCQMRNLSAIPLSAAGRAAKENSLNTSKTNPEDEALEFYFMNHAMAEIETTYAPDEPLPENVLEVVNRYHETMAKIGSRMFHYLLITTTREMRHLGHNQEWKLKDQYGDPCCHFTNSVKGNSQDALFEYNGKLQLGEYLDYLVDVFDKLGWSSSYGGPAWGTVTKCLRDCVKGDTSIEMMLDTAFTLAHNNGPIFNKGFQYSMYDGASLMTILDCQRAGQIPQLIKAGKQFCSRVMPSHQLMVQKIEKLLGKTYNHWVDWEAVEALGSLHSYPHLTELNNQLFGNDPVFVEANKAAIEAAKAAAEKAAWEKAQKEKWQLEIMPQVFVTKMEKKR